MYARRYGLIRTLAPLHVGASEGEESGNLNLIFRDPFTQTGIIPGSSIRGRFRADARDSKEINAGAIDSWYGNSFGDKRKNEAGEEKDFIKEGSVKFENASLLWLPVFCPGQPLVWVSCPRLLKRYAASANLDLAIPSAYSCSSKLCDRAQAEGGAVNPQRTLFFNLGFMTVTPAPDLEQWVPGPLTSDINVDQLVVVSDADIGMIHDMALFRQSRVKLEDTMKRASDGSFFNVEALPEGSVMIFPVAVKQDQAATWQPFQEQHSRDLYFGGLESVGFGRCRVTLMNMADAVAKPAAKEVG
jgi:CRISPR-associated protein Cmr4